MKSVFVKKTTGWAEVKNVFIKKTTGWVKVFTKASLPDTTTSPSIRTTNTGSGSIYDGPSATSPQFLNANLYGKDGVYTNYTSIFGRKFTSGTTSSALTRSTVVTGDLFTSGGGVTTTDRTNLDNKYLFYELTVQNGSSANEIYPISSAIKMIKSYPVLTDFGWTQGEQVGTQLVFNYDIENYYYNKIDPALSYVRWWRSTSTNAGGTLIKEETITATTTGTPSSSQRLGTSYYTPVSADIGYYIVAQITARSSYTDHYGYTDNYAIGSFPTDGVIGSALSVSNVNFTDSNGRSGKNARGNLVTNTATNLNWTVNGVNANTTFRVRYRVLNNQTGLYYKPDTPGTSVAAGSAWLSFTDDYYGSGNISSVSISGSTATLYDAFTIDTTFNGSTYGGGISRWSFQYEISVVNASGTRYYWNYGDSISTTQANDYWDIDPTTNPSISASPASIAPGGSVTFTGTFNPYPSGLNSYPHSYKIVYGDGSDSGWISLSSATANQSYSQSHTYSSAGSYSAYVEVTPTFTTNYAYVTASSVLTSPTITNVTAGNSSGQPVIVYFTGGSGPYYQIWWQSSASTPSSSFTPDAYGASSPLTDSSGPSSAGTWYAFVRSVAVNDGSTTGGATVPSSTFSDWSAGYQFTVTQAPITPTITMNANTSVGNAGATINWSSTNQSYAYVDGTYVGNVNTYTFPGLSSSTYYSGTVTVYSTTGTTASASYSFTTTANITYGPCTPYGSPYYSNSGYECYGTYSYAYTDNYYYQRKEILSNGVWNGSYDYGCANTSVRTYGSYSQVNGQCGYSPPAVTPAIESGPFITWGSGNNYTLSASASNATNLEFQVQYSSDQSGSPSTGSGTYFFGASTGGGTTGSQASNRNWARTRVRANNSNTGLSSAFTGYSDWA